MTKGIAAAEGVGVAQPGPRGQLAHDDEVQGHFLAVHLPDFFICLATQGVRCGSYVQG